MKKKIVFMGTPEFSIETLKVLANSDYILECVYTQPPKKKSRGQKILPSPIQIAGKKLGLKVRNPKTLNDKKEYEYFKSINPYIVIVVAYGNIIPKNYLNLPQKGFINIHASLLPRWRGAAPIQRSIINQDSETGVSFMKIEEKLDTGPYMKQIKIKIEKETTAKILSKKLSKLGADNILECLNLIENGQEKFIEQDNSKVTYAKKIIKSESKINWSHSADEILSRINGLNPTPGAWFEYMGLKYKIWKAEISDITGNPGEVLSRNLIIACKKKSLKIIEIQKEGKNKLSAEEFIMGTKIPEKTIIS